MFSEVHSKALQKTVERFCDNLSTLSEKKQNGHNVGWLNWKSPREYQSMTYSQSGFELKNTSGRTATLWLSKIGDIPIRYHREIPGNAIIKEVTLKKETAGEWYVTFGLEVEDNALPEKPDVDDLDAEDCVGVDLGITNYIYTSDGDSVDWLDLSNEYDRLRREQRSLSRKEHGSNNWEKQRRKVAKVKRRIKRKVEDFQHKLTTWLVTTYDAVFVENLNVSGMLQQRGNARNKQDAAWRGFIEMWAHEWRRRRGVSGHGGRLLRAVGHCGVRGCDARYCRLALVRRSPDRKRERVRLTDTGSFCPGAPGRRVARTRYRMTFPGALAASSTANSAVWLCSSGRGVTLTSSMLVNWPGSAARSAISSVAAWASWETPPRSGVPTPGASVGSSQFRSRLTRTPSVPSVVTPSASVTPRASISLIV